MFINNIDTKIHMTVTPDSLLPYFEDEFKSPLEVKNIWSKHDFKEKSLDLFVTVPVNSIILSSAIKNSLSMKIFLGNSSLKTKLKKKLIK